MTEINITDVINNLVKASENELKLVLTDSIPLAVDASKQYLANLVERSTALLNVVADKDFKGNKLAFVIARLKDEKKILETEVFSFIIIGEGIAQNIINGIQNIIINAIQDIIPAS